MSLRLFRPNEPARVLTPPVGTCDGVSKGRTLRSWLAPAAQLLDRHQLQRGLCMVLLLLGLVVQVVALLFLGYLVDLSVSLMELWAELARKHLELTL